MWTLSCSGWGVVPWPGIRWVPLNWGHGILATGPPAKSLRGTLDLHPWPFNSLLLQPSQFTMYLWQKRNWNLPWFFFFLPHPTGQKILLALPLTYVQILTASCCHFCYPSHATKTSCLGFCGRPALAACVFSYVQFPSWKSKSSIESFLDFHIKSWYPHSAYLLHFLFHFLHSTCTDHLRKVM